MGRKTRDRYHTSGIMPVLSGLLIFGASAVHAQVFTWTGPRAAIPDATPAGIDLTLEVSGLTTSLSDLNFSLDGDGPSSNVFGDRNAGLDHPESLDLTLTLTSPEGTSVVLLDHPATNDDGANFFYTLLDDEAATALSASANEAPFSGRYKPAEPLSAFDSENPNGTWTLNVADHFDLHTGGISQWSLHFSMNNTSPGTNPRAIIQSPPVDDLNPRDVTFVEISGTATDYDGDSLLFVRYRIVPPDADPDTIQLKSATKIEDDWSEWKANGILSVGVNKFEVQAQDSTGKVGPVTTREFLRDDYLYPGPKPDFAYLNSNSALAVAVTNNSGVQPLQTWNALTGYYYDALTGWKTLAMDYNGDGYYDLASVTPVGDVWLYRNNRKNELTGNFQSTSGFTFDEYNGYGVFAGDFNGDGDEDLLQVDASGNVNVGWSNGTKINAPVYVSTPGFAYLPNESHWIGIGDISGDGMDDIVYVNPVGEVWIAFATGTSFSAPRKWLTTGLFKYDRGTLESPLTASDIIIGDFNGDGNEDIGYVNAARDTWVSISRGAFPEAVRSWGNADLFFAPYRGMGWHIYPVDINADAMVDLVQMNEFGQMRFAPSTGNRFVPAGDWVFYQQMYNNILGPRRIFLEHFAE